MNFPIESTNLGIESPKTTTKIASQQKAEAAVRSLYAKTNQVMEDTNTGFNDVDLFSRWVSEKWVSGEKMLFAAILQRAALDVIMFSDSWDSSKRRIGESARRWIFSETKDYFTSFRNVCEVLNLDPGWVRNRVMELVQNAKDQATSFKEDQKK